MYSIRTATNFDRAGIRAVLATVLDEYGMAPDPEGVDADLDDIEGNYAARGGTFRVVEVQDRGIVGCVGLFPLNADDIELRKMYLRADMRRQGIGRRMLEECIVSARQFGYLRLRLETATSLTEAIALYASAGFRRIERPDSVDRCDQAWVLDLQDAADRHNLAEGD